MRLKTLAIKNFRALSDIETEFSEGVSVIVGPNAAGKTTILEAIRLAKAMLAPRTGQEGQQSLISLGAVSPHSPQQLIAEGLVQDPSKNLEVRCGYQLAADEIKTLESGKPLIATNLVQSRVAQANIANFAAFISSQAGQEALKVADREIAEGLGRINTAGGICRLDLTIDFTAGRVHTPDPIGAALIAFLDQSLSPDKTKFSYFPADRALPRGEIPLQLGAQDAAQQMESHNSQPQLKYQRLKNTIFGTIIANENGRLILSEDFETIFSGILKGRELVGASVSEHGLLSIKIRDKESGRIFDIDGLSSGEKGLVLTFLLISRTVAKEGIVLLDEPELHLNPAVCKDLLAFIVDKYVIPNNLQVIICSHSPEILAGAFEREECSLYHLVSPTLLTKVRQSDQEEISEALRLLGTSESEGLLYKGTIFVEGDHDIEVLQAGFGSMLRQYNLKGLGGRQEVEKQIRLLQEAERNGDKLAARYFIFDRDDAPTQLTSTNSVKVLQWSKRCLENYLIDLDVLTDLLKDNTITKTPVRNSGEVATILKTFAIKHLDDEVVKEVYASYNFASLGRRSSEVSRKSFADAADILFGRIETLQGEIADLNRAPWTLEFATACEKKREELHAIWDTEWRDKCDGKRLFQELQTAIQLNMSLLNFKKRVITRMRSHPPVDNWRAIESLLGSLLT